ncbi:DNA/RNA helicase domain-containing protein [Enterococcus hirae]|uniref:DNA/RNA helicase domain-containing protein n=1 Tax=Enterococcus hirae TaxID=1354 RepID=UPI0015C4467B|nr:DNA/RNA helicase domain-containing protein [Enterococcus hirae]
MKLINNSEESSISDEEVTDFFSLLTNKNLLNLLNIEQSKGYFFNYTIKSGIREQFDILRFSIDKVLNIELKSQLPAKGLDQIKNQLIRHKFVLSTLNKKIVCCTYITTENKLYLLTEDNKLEEIVSETLASMIPDDYNNELEIEKINFTHLIISPYSQPELFKEHKYFLTNEQFSIRKEILNSRERVFQIKGGPGTGKTMLLFDLARKYVSENKKVKIIFAGNKFNCEELSSILNIDITPVKNVKVTELEDYDVVLIDEAQRLWEETFTAIFELQNPRLIFSTDHNQTLASHEKNRNIQKRLSENKNVETKKLKEKIRTDPAMGSFIKKFLDLKARGIQKYEYSKVTAEYFSTKQMAEKYIKSLVDNENFVSIEVTDYTTKSTWKKKREKVYWGSETAHSVIGEEYDNVLVPLDNYFYYNEDQKLVSSYADQFYYPYNEDSCIFEALTRTKDRLVLVIINNPNLFITVQEILTWKKDSEKEN